MKFKHRKSAATFSLCFLCCLILPQTAYARQAETIWQQRATAKLFPAIEQDDMAGVRELLARGVSANAADDWGRSALMWAASRANIPLCRLLLKHGVVLNRTDNHGETALSIALSQGGGYWTQPLAPIRPRPAEAAYAATARWLVEQGADVNLSLQSGQSVVKVAFMKLNDWAPMCEYLIRHGAKLFAPGQQLTMDLDAAARAGQEKWLTLFLQQHPTRSEKDAALAETLTRLAEKGPIPVVEIRKRFVAHLLAAGADPDVENARGYSALDLAVFAGDADLAHRLIAHGAKVNLKCKAGFTPLGTAKWLSDDAMQALLTQAGARE